MPAPAFKSTTAGTTSANLIVGSESSGGAMISVAATASPGTLIHLVPLTGLDYQRIKVWAVNRDTVERTLTIQFGGVAAKDGIPWRIGPQRGLVLVVPDLKLQRGLSVLAYCPTANVFSVYVGVGERDKSP